MGSTSTLGYILLALSIGYVFVYSSVGEIYSLQDSKIKHQEFLSTVSNIEDKKNKLLEEFNKISEEDKKRINTVLPDSLDFVKLVSEIDSAASNSGISIDNISLTELGSSSGDSIADAVAPTPYKSAIIGFSFVTSYEKFNNFISIMEKSMRILDIRSIRIMPDEKSGYSYNVQFETYWLPR